MAFGVVNILQSAWRHWLVRRSNRLPVDGITMLYALRMVMSLLLVQEIMGHLDIEIKNARLLQC